MTRMTAFLMCLGAFTWTASAAFAQTGQTARQQPVSFAEEKAAGAAEEAVGRMGEVARALERGAGWLAEGRVHLHPDEINLLRLSNAGFAWVPWLIALAALVYAIAS